MEGSISYKLYSSNANSFCLTFVIINAMTTKLGSRTVD